MLFSEHEEKMLNLRTQVQHNHLELQDYLSDLKNWEKDIKKKEDVLKSENQKKVEKTQSELPPVRNTIHKKKLKKKKKEKPVEQNKPKRISGYDFHSWDKFDVDKALEEIDKNDTNKDTSSSEYETDEEWELERKKYLASIEKEKGNELLKNGDLEKAIEAYSKGMLYDPTNAILPANRGMALLKQQKFAACELDCTLSLTLDQLYIKAYLRRATARSSMGKLNEAAEDYKRVLDLEPANKLAKTELEHLLKEVDRDKKQCAKSSFTEGKRGLVKPIYKPPEERSKLPLKVVPISEISLRQSKPLDESNRNQSEMAKKFTAKEGKEFDKFINPASSSPAGLPSGRLTSSTEVLKTAVVEPKASLVEEIIDPDHGAGKLGQRCGAVSDHLSKGDASQARVETSEPTRLGNSVDQLANSVDQLGNSAYQLGSGDSLGVPTTSFQFQSDYKVLKNKPESFIQYFQAIDPAKYAQLFGQCLDVDILKTILTCLKMYSNSLSVSLYDVMFSLTLVKRFAMTAMFLSQKEKQVVSDLIQLLKNQQSYSPEQLTSLKQKYDL